MVGFNRHVAFMKHHLNSIHSKNGLEKDPLLINGGIMKKVSDSGNAQPIVTFTMVIGTLVGLILIFGKLYATANHTPIGHF